MEKGDKEMSKILLTGCHRCQPEKWRAGREAVGIYWCPKCRKFVTRVMERKETGK